MSDKEVNTFVEKWTLALNVTDNIRIDDIPPAEKGLRKALVVIKDLQAHNTKLTKENTILKEKIKGLTNDSE